MKRRREGGQVQQQYLSLQAILLHYASERVFHLSQSLAMYDEDQSSLIEFHGAAANLDFTETTFQ